MEFPQVPKIREGTDKHDSLPPPSPHCTDAKSKKDEEKKLIPLCSLAALPALRPLPPSKKRPANANGRAAAPLSPGSSASAAEAVAAEARVCECYYVS